ncbi:MAG: bacterioferritin [Planctomycetota bacterium]|jgi:bacterioferritin
MQGKTEIIELLNEVLTSELTAINQYYAHYKMCQDWGFHGLAKSFREFSMEEMKDADEIMERILFLDGLPNMQRLGPVTIGENPEEQIELLRQAEAAAVERLNRGIALCRDMNDNGSRQMLEKMLIDEEEHLDWAEAQQHVIKTIGASRYLAEKLGESNSN